MALEAADGRRGELMTPLLGGDVDIARRRETFYCAGNRGGKERGEIITIMYADSNKIEQIVVQLGQVTLRNFRYGAVGMGVCATRCCKGTYSELDR